ncbi:AraC family transcriptional regulator [Paenibacillus sp. 481]|uniref:AraC family transcriptional regulator n=1 Tax=Paenibacillus sp. 481 TaxID=2835869 RepID=UPI001E3CFE5D|nr:AraC family transcriptional regulator [Paenibacillus sp. 481]UHA73213.1 AraC family transcriptional regulator [Paenibacillus sp. 481]
MALVESLQKAIDYMEAHLLRSITIEHIAKQANMSPSHFQRTFWILTDTSVGEYLRRRRLTIAAQQLISTNCRLVDLAYACGYDTPESFTKAFRKQHGVTPSDVRKGIGQLQSYNRLMIQVNLKGVEPMKYHIVERDAFQVIGIKRTVSFGQECAGTPNIGQFWGEAHANGTVDQLTGLINGQLKGLLGITENYNTADSTIDYWIAAEHQGTVPAELASLHFPASKWVVFEISGPVPAALIEAWKKIYSEWFPSNGYEPAEIAPLEVYLAPDLDRADAYNEIWVAIK